MIKILFICHGTTNDYCFVFEILGQNEANESFCCAYSHCGKTTINESKINKCSSQW